VFDKSGTQREGGLYSHGNGSAEMGFAGRGSGGITGRMFTWRGSGQGSARHEPRGSGASAWAWARQCSWPDGTLPPPRRVGLAPSRAHGSPRVVLAWRRAAPTSTGPPPPPRRLRLGMAVAGHSPRASLL
jgi:hypothetical protein